MSCILCGKNKSNKNKSSIFLFNNKNYCINHSKLLFSNIIIKIQKTFRGYKLRKYLKAIYYKLPRDLQLHILKFNTNTNNIYNINYTNFIKKFIHNKTYKINSLSNIRLHEITLLELNSMVNKLIIYKKFIDTNWINYYKYYFDNIYNIFTSLLDTHYSPRIVDIHIYNSINFYSNLINEDFSDKANQILTRINLFNIKRRKTML